MQKEKLFSKKQLGFITGMAMTVQVLHVMKKWNKILDNGGNLDDIYMDFTKVFDTVPPGGAS